MADLSQRLAALSPEKRQLLARRLGAPREGSGPVAVVGMACRFPGGVTSPEAFWELLRDGRDGVGEAPPGRDTGPFRTGGFLADVDLFDAAFFGISPREATFLDPQHRLLLEVAWEALEDAGLTPEGLAGSATGVFAAVYQRDYARLALEDPEALDAYFSSGTHHSIAANRLSYLLDLRGPSLVVDTACSSSLVALHLACQSLRRGECDTTLVGAANLVLAPEETLALERWGMLAQDGRCKTFDARADGFVRGEGAAVVVLRRLADAEAGGDEVLALVRGTAVNQDGRSNGLTAPNGEAQRRVIRAALAEAGVEASRVTYVETHGTGTALGDPIEVEALVEALGTEGPPCLLGAVKANLGHLEAAAGVAGLVKTVLCLRHGRVPPQLHLRRLNPMLPLAGSRFEIPTKLEAWEVEDGPRIAGLSSFGMGGTNAHAVLEEAPPRADREVPEDDGQAFLFPLSARSPEALVALAEGVRQDLDDDPAPFADLCSAAALRRAHHPHRLAAVARSTAELGESLRAFGRGEARPGLSWGEASDAGGGRVFVFPGQGWQWPGMGLALADAEPAFRDALEACASAIEVHTGRSFHDAWRGGEGWGEIDVLQPVLFALQVAMAAQWRAWGVEPDAVIGHSLGEVAAAHVAGILDLGDAARVICRRSRLLRRLAGRGAMAVVELDREAAEAEVAGRPGLAVAAENGPRSTVLSGDPEALDEVLADLERREVFCRKVEVDVASHGPQVDSLKGDVLAALDGLAPRPAKLRFYSTVDPDCGGADLDAAYWQRNLRQPVLFWSAALRALDDGHTDFLEISGHPILLPALEAGASGRRPLLLGCWRRGEDERAQMLGTLGELYRHGRVVDWRRVAPPPGGKVRFPPYPWQRRRYWLAPARRRALSGPSAGPPALLGAAALELAGAAGLHVWEGVVDPARTRFLADHRVGESVVLPGVAYLGVVAAAARDVLGDAPFTFRDVTFHRPLLVEPPPAVQWTLRRDDDDGDSGAVFECHARAADGGGPWALQASGHLRLGAPEAPAAEPPAPRGEEVAGTDFYRRTAAAGNGWGPSFQGVERVVVEGGEVWARVRVPAAVVPELGEHPFHPAVLDACGQPLVLCLGEEAAPAGPFVLAGLEEVRLVGRPEEMMWSRLRLRPERPPGGLVGDVRVFADDGRVLAELRGLRLDFPGQRRGGRLTDSLYVVAWRPAPLSLASSVDGRYWLVGGGEVGEALAARLRAAGAEVVTSDVPVPDGVGWRVVDLGALAGAPPGGAAELCAGGLALARRLEAPGFLARRGLWWVTVGAQAVGSAAVSPAQAGPWGLARGLRGEHPDVLAAVVDLEPGLAAEAAADVVARELLAAGGEPAEDRVAWRGGERFVPRLEPWRLGSERPVTFSPDATYLVTGGLGGLGLEVARRFVERGACHLVLVGRTADPAAAREVEELGASVRVVAADVGTEEGLGKVLESCRQGPEVRGVVHAAGVQEPRPWRDLEREALAAELAAKAVGGWGLHRAFADVELDFMVFFSSSATLLDSPFLAAYSAANASLDAVAAERRRLGLPAVSVAWGFWSEVGMAERLRRERGRELLPRGMSSFAPSEGLDVLEALLAGAPANVAVLPADWGELLSHHPAMASSPLLAELRDTSGPRPKVSPTDVPTLSDDPDERRRQLEGYLRRRVAWVLRVAPGELPADVALTGLGLDSLMATELKNRVHEELGLDVPIVRFLGSFGLRRLAEELSSKADEAEEETFTI